MQRKPWCIAGAIVATGVTSLAMFASPAVAGTTNFRLNSVGSDVTFCVSSHIDSTFNTASKSTTGDKVYDTPPYLDQNIGCEDPTPSTYTIPKDSVHTSAITYNSSNEPPDGSGAGITAFIDDNGAGTIAFVRSTSGRKSTYPPNLEFWAYALDAISWDHFTGTAAGGTTFPANLTAAQIQGIYNCTYTNWDQVGGSDQTITRFYPVTTSGTASFFAQLFLGGSEPVSTSSCPIEFVPQNDATQVTDYNGVNYDSSAILPYSYGNYYSQTHKTAGEANLAAGTVLGKVNGVAPTAKSITEEEAFANISGDACTSAPVAGQFCGSRYIYNVTWQELPASYYDAVINLIGVPSSGTAGADSVCSDKYATTIKNWGFQPLGLNTTAQSTSSDPVPGTSYCRQF